MFTSHTGYSFIAIKFAICLELSIIGPTSFAPSRLGVLFLIKFPPGTLDLTCVCGVVVC